MGQPLKTARIYVGYVGGSARVYAFTNERVSLFLNTIIGVLIPEAEVVHGTTSAAELGRPLFEVQLGLDLRLFALEKRKN